MDNMHTAKETTLTVKKEISYHSPSAPWLNIPTD